MKVRVHLLGGLRLIVDGTEITRFRTQKTAQLLAILALEAGGPVRRESLIEALWPGAATSLARNSLSQSLAALRRDVGDAILADRQTASLVAESDVADFLSAVQAVEAASSEAIPPLARAALERCPGSLLPGWLEPWAVHRRLQIADRVQGVIERWREACSTPAEHLEVARMSTALDPTSESASTALIEILFDQGQAREAEAEFRRLQGRLMSELGMKPSPALSRLVLERVRQHTDSHWWVLSVGRDPERSPTPEAALARARVLARQGLPTQIARTPGEVEVDTPGLHWRIQETPELSRALGEARLVSVGSDFVRLLEPPKGGSIPKIGPLVGREQLLGEALEALSGTRILTLIGAGGNGKTRLAIAVGETLQAGGEHVVWISLAEVRDADHVHRAIADALGVRGDDALEAIVTELDGSTLMILDNLEQIEGDVDGAVQSVLHRLPRLRVVGTSRRRIGSSVEREFQVPALDGETGADVELFRLRASPGLGEDAWSVHQVQEICRALGGSPLAIELVAARTAVLPLREIAERLDEALDWPHRERRPGHRQHTLRSTVEWSLDLLDPGPLQTLSALAFLNGSASTSLLTTLTADPGTSEHLLQLREASLVVSAEGSGPRSNLLDTIRAVARDRLRHERPLESDRLKDRLADWGVSYSEGQADRLRGPEQKEALDRLSEEHGHLRQALASTIDAHDDRALRLGIALWRFWHLRSHLVEGAVWMQRALAAIPRSPLRPPALNGLGRLAYLQGDYAVAERAHREALELAHDDDARALALNGLGSVSYERGAHEDALTSFEESLALRVALEDRFGEGNVLNWIGLTLTDAGRHREAIEMLERSLTVRRSIGDESGMARSLGWLGTVFRRLGEPERAEGLYREALAIHTVLGDRRGQAGLLGNLGLVERDLGNFASALSLLQEAEAIHAEIGDRWGVATMLLERGRILASLGSTEEARDLLGQARSMREAMGNLPGVAEVDKALVELADGRYSRP